jgi:diguanylate cyclase (GGDEF)-like protein
VKSETVFDLFKANFWRAREDSMTIRVFIHDRPLKRRLMQINKDSASIGRGPSNDIQIDDPSVSKRHAIIFQTPKGYTIEDQRSQNGTWIDGTLIASGKKIKIETGMPISIGNVLVSVGKSLPPDFVSAQTCIDLKGYATECDSKSVLNDTLMTNRRKLQQIFEISKSLTQSLDIKEVYEKILDSLFLHFKKLEVGAILLRDETSGSLSQVATKIRDRRKSKGLRISQSILKQAIDQSKAVLITDTSHVPDSGFSESIKVSRIVSAMCVPLITKAGIRGVIYVYSSNSQQGFKKEDLFFITSISNPAAVAIENALLRDKTKQSEEELKRARDELETKVQERTSELAEANAKLRDLSITDDLTGLFNRRYLVKSLEAEFIRAIRYKRHFSVLLFDIDDFKQVNDRYGHSCGDAVLITLASLIKGCIRGSDMTARYGGDEIAILLPETEKSKATEVAEKLRGLIEKTSFEWQGTAIKITCSIGIASAPDDRIANWNDLLDKADQALYRGKGTGKNIVFTFNTDKGQSSAANREPV